MKQKQWLRLSGKQYANNGCGKIKEFIEQKMKTECIKLDIDDGSIERIAVAMIDAKKVLMQP